MTIRKAVISQDRLNAAMEENLYGNQCIGFCVACGEEADIEPDAVRIECDHCGNYTVYGIEELIH